MCSHSDRAETRSGTRVTQEPGSKIKGDGTASRLRRCLHIGFCGTRPKRARAAKTLKPLFWCQFFGAFLDPPTLHYDRARHGPKP